jgi:hypothetical protein
LVRDSAEAPRRLGPRLRSREFLQVSNGFSNALSQRGLLT